MTGDPHRKRWPRLAGAALVLAILPASPAPAGSTVRAWLVPSLERIPRSAPAVSRDSLEIRAAKGETESFQLGLAADGGADEQVALHVDDFVGPGGARISASAVTAYREHYVEVKRGSPDPGGSNRPLGAGWYADGLVPLGKRPGGSLSPMALRSGETQPVWFDVAVPRDALPGRYDATVTARSDQGTRRVTVSLRVWDFALPERPALNSLFIASHAGLPAKIELLRHRLMPRDVPPSEQKSLIQSWGLKSTNAGFWSGADGQTCSMGPVPSVAEIRRAAARNDPSLQLFNYTADEIDRCNGILPDLRAWASALHGAGIDNLVTMSPRAELLDDGSGRSVVDIWVLLPTMYEAARGAVAKAQAKGDQVWSYNALVQDDHSPKWQIDFAPINYRIQPGFISQSLGLTGLLYWQVDRWTDDPWTNVQTYQEDGHDFPGEGQLVYPGEPMGVSGVLPSMRLKWLRDGADDYDYVALLKRRGCAAFGLQVARELGGSWRSWTHDADLLERRRAALGDYVEAALKTTGACPRP